MRNANPAQLYFLEKASTGQIKHFSTLSPDEVKVYTGLGGPYKYRAWEELTEDEQNFVNHNDEIWAP